MTSFKKILVFFAFLLMTIIISGCSTKSVYKNNFDIVYNIESKMEGKKSLIGTCFYSNGRFYTNAHLILYKELGEYIVAESIVATDEINNINYKLEVVIYDLTNDTAILKSTENIGLGLKLNINYETTIGEEIYTIGNLNNYGLAYGYGRITSYSKTITNLENRINYVQTNIEISNGNSGGPVFNSENEVIGIMSLKLVDNNQYVDGVSFFVLMKEYGI